MRIQAKSHAGNKCLRFPQVTVGDLPAPQIVYLKPLMCGAGWIFPILGRFSSSSTTQIDQSNQLLLPLKSVVNPSKLISHQKRWTVQCRLFNPSSNKTRLTYTLFSVALFSTGTGCCYSATFFSKLMSERKMPSKTIVWAWKRHENNVLCVLDDLDYYGFWKNHIIAV